MSVKKQLGTHIILDMHGKSDEFIAKLKDSAFGEKALKQAVEKAGATLLTMDIHDFKTGDMCEYGFSGAAILSESHISVHTWPEEQYAAFDVFMCGDSKPELAVDALKAAFGPDTSETVVLRRGLSLAGATEPHTIGCSNMNLKRVNHSTFLK